MNVPWNSKASSLICTGTAWDCARTAAVKQAALPSPIPTQTVLAAASIHSHDICLQIDVVSLPCHVEAVLRLGSGEKAVQRFKLLLEVPAVKCL